MANRIKSRLISALLLACAVALLACGAIVAHGAQLQPGALAAAVSP